MEQLRLARLRCGLSQAALAERAGMRPSTILRLEQGRAQPRPATLGKLSHALGCSVDALLTPAELATVGTRPRATRSNGAQDRDAAAGREVCAACGQPLTAADWRHLAAGGRVHRACWKRQQPRPPLAPCCREGPRGQR